MKAKSKRNGEVYEVTEEFLAKYGKDWEVVQEVEDNEYTYKELKDKLTEMGVEFKKNASKETLQQLLNLEGEVI